MFLRDKYNRFVKEKLKYATPIEKDLISNFIVILNMIILIMSFFIYEPMFIYLFIYYIILLIFSKSELNSNLNFIISFFPRISALICICVYDMIVPFRSIDIKEIRKKKLNKIYK